MAAARRRLLWALLPPLFALCPAQTEPPGSLGLSLHPPYFNLAETAGIWATATCGEKEEEEEEEEEAGGGGGGGGGGRPELYCKLVGGPAAAPLGRAIQVACGDREGRWWGQERGNGTERGSGAADPALSPGGLREGGRGSEDGDGGWRFQSCGEEKQKSSRRVGGSVFCAWAETCQGREGAASAASSVVCWGWWSESAPTERGGVGRLSYSLRPPQALLFVLFLVGGGDRRDETALREGF